MFDFPLIRKRVAGRVLPRNSEKPIVSLID